MYKLAANPAHLAGCLVCVYELFIGTNLSTSRQWFTMPARRRATLNRHDPVTENMSLSLNRFADDTSMLGFRYLHSKYDMWFRCVEWTGLSTFHRSIFVQGRMVLPVVRLRCDHMLSSVRSCTLLHSTPVDSEYRS